jgi:hypothetical protein
MAVSAGEPPVRPLSLESVTGTALAVADPAARITPSKAAIIVWFINFSLIFPNECVI